MHHQSWVTFTALLVFAAILITSIVFDFHGRSWHRDGFAAEEVGEEKGKDGS